MLTFKRGASLHSSPNQNAFEELIAQSAYPQLTKFVKIGHLRGAGGFADVYDGWMKGKDKQRTKVAVKKFRVILNQEEKVVKTFSRELSIWGQIKHKNVLPLLGIMLMDGIPCMVSEWMENGTMNAYLKTNTGANVMELIQDVAHGLAYLHVRDVVHSDLKGDNVLISAGGRAVLTDFGTSRLLKNNVTIAGTQTFKGNARWTAPEIFQPIEEQQVHMFHTKSSDVWAFGMVVYEALVRDVPFFNLRSEVQVIATLTRNEIPSRPNDECAGMPGFTLLWSICQVCWSYEPASRPPMQAITSSLNCKGVFLWNVSTLKDSECCISPTGRFLAVTNGRMPILFANLKTWDTCGPGLNMDCGVYKVAWSNAEEHIVISTFDGILKKWGDLFDSPTLIAQSTDKHKWAFVEFSPDDRVIASFSPTHESGKLWDASNLSLLWEYKKDVSSVAFHPSGRRVIFSRWKFHVIDIDIENLENITAEKCELDHDVDGLVFDPSGDTCFALTFTTVKVLSADTFEKKTKLPYHDCTALQVAPNGRHVLLVLRQGEVVVWDMVANEAVEEMSLGVTTDYYSVQISKTCREICTYDSDTRISHFFRLSTNLS